MENENGRTITELSQLDGRVYVHLATPELARQFMQQAEAEGFTFADGVKPTKRDAPDIIAVNADRTINYIGIFGRMAFGSGAESVEGKPLILIEFVGNSDTPIAKQEKEEIWQACRIERCTRCGIQISRCRLQQVFRW